MLGELSVRGHNDALQASHSERTAGRDPRHVTAALAARRERAVKSTGGSREEFIPRERAAFGDRG
jgi:hypothetical protein